MVEFQIPLGQTPAVWSVNHALASSLGSSNQLCPRAVLALWNFPSLPFRGCTVWLLLGPAPCDENPSGLLAGALVLWAPVSSWASSVNSYVPCRLLLSVPATRPPHSCHRTNTFECRPEWPFASMSDRS